MPDDLAAEVKLSKVDLRAHVYISALTPFIVPDVYAQQASVPNDEQALLSPLVQVPVVAAIEVAIMTTRAKTMIEVLILYVFEIFNYKTMSLIFLLYPKFHSKASYWFII